MSFKTRWIGVFEKTYSILYVLFKCVSRCNLALPWIIGLAVLPNFLVGKSHVFTCHSCLSMRMPTAANFLGQVSNRNRWGAIGSNLQGRPFCLTLIGMATIAANVLYVTLHGEWPRQEDEAPGGICFGSKSREILEYISLCLPSCLHKFSQLSVQLRYCNLSVLSRHSPLVFLPLQSKI